MCPSDRHRRGDCRPRVDRARGDRRPRPALRRLLFRSVGRSVDWTQKAFVFTGPEVLRGAGSLRKPRTWRKLLLLCDSVGRNWRQRTSRPSGNSSAITHVRTLTYGLRSTGRGTDSSCTDIRAGSGELFQARLIVFLVRQ